MVWMKRYHLRIRIGADPQRIVNAFKGHGIVPDVVETVPNKKLYVSFDGGVDMDLGNTLTPAQVQNPPKVTWSADNGDRYTLIVVDAPSRRDLEFRECRQWLVVNIRGSDLANSDTLTKYSAPDPPANTGVHRCVFLVYKQDGHILEPEYDKVPRHGWSTAEFVAKHKLGEPLFGNFFLSSAPVELKKKAED